MSIMGNMADAWDRFTDSLNSAGGTIALLFISTALLGFGVMHIMHHGDTGSASEVVKETFSNFTGALLLALTQRSRSNGNGSPSAPPKPLISEPTNPAPATVNVVSKSAI